jgi:hypothetical protein
MRFFNSYRTKTYSIKKLKKKERKKFMVLLLCKP